MLALLPPATGSASGNTPPRRDAAWVTWLIRFIDSHSVLYFLILYMLLITSLTIAGIVYLFR